jgi:hypothetical protein
LEVTFTLLGVRENVREWTHTLPSRLPLWELESWIFRKWFEGLKFIKLKTSLPIRNLLRHICLKWVRMIHLSTYNTSYGWKKGKESKCQFDYWPLKVKNHLELRVWRWRATYRWKAFNKGYNFSLDLALVKGLHKKLWVSKVARVRISRISKLLTWESEENDIWVQPSWPIIENIIWGKVVASPKFGPLWVLLIYVCSCFVYAPKVLQLRIHQLVVWFLDVHVNNWPACHLS